MAEWYDRQSKANLAAYVVKLESDLAAARTEIERLTKERDEALALLADAYGAGTGGSVIEARLADAERDMRQRAADEAVRIRDNSMVPNSEFHRRILALPLKHADREGGV
ncbi:hypothetical protein [Paracoccus yeei]|uniref:hypothetical protein n=1 Tax=Paracoccus yeei TaxID=147645 RepID=UPI00174803FD|nr:hypothetical protein [Paracoccus yeei]